MNLQQPPQEIALLSMIKTQMNDKEKNKGKKSLKWLLDLHRLTCWLALSFSQLLHIHIQVIGAVSTCNHRSLWMFLGVVTYSYIFFSNHLITQKDPRNWINTEITNWIIIFDLFKNHWYQKTLMKRWLGSSVCYLCGVL